VKRETDRNESFYGETNYDPHREETAAVGEEHSHLADSCDVEDGQVDVFHPHNEKCYEKAGVGER